MVLMKRGRWSPSRAIKSPNCAYRRHVNKDWPDRAGRRWRREEERGWSPGEPLLAALARQVRHHGAGLVGLFPCRPCARLAGGVPAALRVARAPDRIEPAGISVLGVVPPFGEGS